jgi:YHS domain-containing protein
MEKFMKTHAWKAGITAGAAVFLVLAAGRSAAAEDIVNTGYFGDVAIKGYDAVAYFTEHKAVKGSEKFTYHWLGANWHFASAENRELFRREPVRYAPQYGGYCADGVSAGTITTNIDPKAWRIIDGKLYLSYDPGAADGLEKSHSKVVNSQKYWPEVKRTLMSADAKKDWQ